MTEPSKEAFYKDLYKEVHANLCDNGLNYSVAHFLADLCVRVEKLERHEL